MTQALSVAVRIPAFSTLVVITAGIGRVFPDPSLFPLALRDRRLCLVSAHACLFFPFLSDSTDVENIHLSIFYI